jgi:hypothetical protein
MVAKIKNENPLFQTLKPAAKPRVVYLPKEFPKDPSHRFGTCWKCGLANEIPGGDFFKCSEDGWLPWKIQLTVKDYAELKAQIVASGAEPIVAIVDDLVVERRSGDRSDLELVAEVVELPEEVDNCGIPEDALLDMDDDDF